MSLYKYIRNLWKKPKEGLGDLWQQRLIKWRRQPVTLRLERPTRLDRARSLGYKAKQGIFVVRQRVNSGGHRTSQVGTGRRPKRYNSRVDLQKSYQIIAEQRASQRYKANCEVLNSYWVAKDGHHYWYEVIMIDKSSPVIQKDKNYNWITNPANRARVQRGLTSAGKKSRGLRTKGKGAEKLRPSRSAIVKRKNIRRANKPKKKVTI